jgi:hypothetical protein
LSVTSEDVSDEMAGKCVTLALVNGQARNDVAGEVKKNVTNGEVSSLASLADNGLPDIRQKLLPILEGSGGIRCCFNLTSVRPEPSASPGTINLDQRPCRAAKKLRVGVLWHKMSERVLVIGPAVPANNWVWPSAGILLAGQGAHRHSRHG